MYSLVCMVIDSLVMHTFSITYLVRSLPGINFWYGLLREYSEIRDSELPNRLNGIFAVNFALLDARVAQLGKAWNWRFPALGVFLVSLSPQFASVPSGHSSFNNDGPNWWIKVMVGDE